MTDKLRDALGACLDWMEAARASGDAGFWEWGPDDEYTRGRAALAAAPQPAVVDREAMVAAVRNARIAWANDGDAKSCPDAAIADALLARGLRLPAPETMAWAVVGEDGKPDPYRVYAHNRNPYVSSMENLAPVAIRVVEGGDDAA